MQSSIKLIWRCFTYHDDKPIFFGNRRDALVYAYRELFEILRIYDASHLAPEGSPYQSLMLSGDILSNDPHAYAIYLYRQIAKTNGRYGIDDHFSDEDRWGRQVRIKDMDAEIGDIDISVHDRIGQSSQWHNCAVVSVKQFPLVDSPNTDFSKLRELIDSITYKTPQTGFTYVPGMGLVPINLEKIDEENDGYIFRNRRDLNYRIEKVASGTIIYPFYSSDGRSGVFSLEQCMPIMIGFRVQ